MIQVRNFSFWYPGVSSPALDDISFSVEKGKFVLVVGASGCGKSTLLLALNGVVPQLTGGKVGGRVFVDGADTRETPVSKLSSQVGLILQDPESQLTNLFVYDEIAFGPENLNLPDQEIIDRVEEALAKTNITDLRNRSVFALSGGQKQRVAIAAALAMRPSILLMDNPTSNLDPAGAAETCRTIRDMRAKNPDMTIILADHRPDALIDLADRILVMDHGRIIEDGAPRNVYSDCGIRMKDDLGIFLPQVAEFGVELRRKGIHLPKIPLTIPETIQMVDDLEIPWNLPDKSRDGTTTEPRARNEIIHVEDVIYEYPTGNQAVNGVSLSAKDGEFICLVGQNGSGKTTLAKLMVGLLKAKGGSIHLFNRNITSISLSELLGSVGYVFQYPDHQFVTSNVYDEIAYSPRAMKMPEQEISRRVEEMLGLFALQDSKNLPPQMLSKGQKRRLSVATMLVTSPRLLILDEPMTGQDQTSIVNLLAILNQLRAQGTTIIDITHDMEHVATYADRVVGMSKGRIIFDGNPPELFDQAATLKELALEPPPMALVADFLRRRGSPIPKASITLDQIIGQIRPADKGA